MRLKDILLSGLFFSFFIYSCKQETEEANAEPTGESKEATYQNPVLDQNFPDPTVIKAKDGYYYAYGTNSGVNGETWNIQVARSRDLIHWTEIGDALPSKPSWADRDFWAPHVLYDSTTSTYYLYYSGESINEDVGKCLGVATSKSPAGPFVDKGVPLLCGETFVNIDPMAFDDPVSGKKLLYWGSGHQPIKVQELSDDRLDFKNGSEVIELIDVIPDEGNDNYQKLVEGSWVVYRGGFYYLFYSGDNCCGSQAHYAVMVARSKNATGPFEMLSEGIGKNNNVILEKNDRWIAPGHNSVVTDDAGQDWIVYHAIDSSDGKKGRVMLIDPITYENGWPVIKSNVPSTTKVNAPVVNR